MSGILENMPDDTRSGEFEQQLRKNRVVKDVAKSGSPQLTSAKPSAKPLHDSSCEHGALEGAPYQWELAIR